MAAPIKYERSYSFSSFQATNPNRPLPAAPLDNELANVETSISKAVDAINDIRRADGKLKNGIVTADALAPGLATGVDPATNWATGIAYSVNATVFNSGAFYRCLTAHTSGTFAIDLAAGRWELFADYTTYFSSLQAAATNSANSAATSATQANSAATSATAAAASAAASAAAIAALPNYSDGANLNNGSVANSKLADMAQGTLKGRAAGAGTGSPVDVTDAQLRTIIGNVSSATAGLAPASGGGTVNFLRADGTWTSPGGILLATQQATTSGTQFDFTGLPAGLNEIVVSFDRVALSGTDNLLVQLGTSEGIDATGYVSTSVLTFGGNGVQAVNSTTGFIIFYSSSVHACTGHMFIRRMSGNKWTQSHNCMLDTIRDVHAGGVKTLSGEIDRIRITRTGTNTFTAGSVNISYSR